MIDKKDFNMAVRNFHKILTTLLIFVTPLPGLALSYPQPHAGNQLIGRIHIIQSHSGDTLYKLSRRFEMGYYEMTKANPKLPKHDRIPKGTGVTIPSLFILPDAPQKGITVNLPEMRLYYYHKDRPEIITEPIAIGRLGWGTPEVATYVIEKIKDPIWVVPESIQLYSFDKGQILPDIMAPGPDNPLGQYALRLAIGTILIHGTNRPNSIGRRISSGCIRLYPEDIQYLFHEVDQQTPVYIVNQPYKVGWQHNHLYLEVHKPLDETTGFPEEEQAKVYQLIINQMYHHPIKVNWHTVAKILHEHSGIPRRIDQ
jgi:L,D-transpeptidase ErfK/SrfK